MTCIILHNNQLKWTPSLLSFSEVFLQCTMFWHFSDVFPIFFWRKKIAKWSFGISCTLRSECYGHDTRSDLTKKNLPLHEDLTLWKSHHIKNSIQLFMVIWIACLDIFLATMEYWFTCQQLSKNTSYCPYIWRKSAMERAWWYNYMCNI